MAASPPTIDQIPRPFSIAGSSIMLPVTPPPAYYPRKMDTENYFQVHVRDVERQDSDKEE